MGLVVNGTLAKFEDVCTVEDALPLLDFLKSGQTHEVDLSACTHLHTALLQLLLAACPTLACPPADPILMRWVAPLLTSANGEREV